MFDNIFELEQWCHIMDEKVFEQRLRETVAWCTRTHKVSKSAEYLRTPALKPSIHGDSSLFMAESNQATDVIEAISQTRKKLLTHEALLADGNNGLAGGRLLAYFLGASNHNGVTASISDYFDDEDNPPWDTWICCIAGKEQTSPDEKPFDLRIVLSQRTNTTDYVLSWVPPEWIEEVTYAMRCECVGAIMWADALIFRPEIYVFDFHRCYIPAWLERYTDGLFLQ